MDEIKDAVEADDIGVRELIKHGHADVPASHAAGAFAACTRQGLDDDVPDEIVNIFQGSEVEMVPRYRQEPLPKLLA